jgi:hypothetical protein
VTGGPRRVARAGRQGHPAAGAGHPEVGHRRPVGRQPGGRAVGGLPATAKGRRLYDWARVEQAAPAAGGCARWLLVRRSRRDGELAFYACYGPAETSLLGLVRRASARPQSPNVTGGMGAGISFDSRRCSHTARAVAGFGVEQLGCGGCHAIRAMPTAPRRSPRSAARRSSRCRSG